MARPALPIRIGVLGAAANGRLFRVVATVCVAMVAVLALAVAAGVGIALLLSRRRKWCG